MFATVEEAEKAVAMLRRFAPGVECGYDHVERVLQVWGPGLPDGGAIFDWEQVADFLLARQEDQADRRAGPNRAKVREYLNTAHDICNATTSDKSVAIRALIYAVEELLR